MRVDESIYNNINSWSNPSIAKLLYFTYGPISMDKPIPKQKVKFTEPRRMINEYFILPNIEDISNTSFIDRYNILKEFKFDPDIYIEYLDKLISASDITENIIIDEPYKSGVIMKNGYLNFVMEFSLFSVKILKESLEVLKSSKIWNH